MTDFAEFHDELRSVARTILSSATSGASRGDPPPPVAWDVLAAAGWLGLEVSERLGGAGVTFVETAIVLDELARAAATTGYFGTVVLGVAALNAVTPGAERDDLLRAIAGGEIKVAVALEPDPANPGCAGPPFRIEAGRLSGGCEFVLDAAEADTLLLPSASHSGDTVLVVVDATRRNDGLVVASVDVVDGTRRLATVHADNLELDASRVMTFVDPTRALQQLSDRAAVAIACDSLGVAEAMLAATVTYVSQRVQFDRPIGSFQAVKHACADMLVEVTIGRELLDAAIDAVTSGDSTIEAAMAKSYLATAGVDVVGSAMQLHGGIGYAWESGVHLYLKRAILDRQLFGSPSAHRQTVARRYAGTRASQRLRFM